MTTLAEAQAAVAQGTQQNALMAQASSAATATARRLGLDPARFRMVFGRLIAQESGWDPDAYNAGSGASGIAQIVPRWHPTVDPWDPAQALPYAADYLGSMIVRYGGDWVRGTAAYNYGPGNVDAIAGLDDQSFYANLPGETQSYLGSVLGGGTMGRQQQKKEVPADTQPQGGGGGGGGQGGGGDDLDAAFQAFLSGQATDDQLRQLMDFQLLTAGQAMEYVKQRDAAPDASPVSGLYPYDPASGLVSAYPAESPIGSMAVEGNGPPNLYADPSAGLLYNRKGSLLPKYLQPGYGGGVGGGGGITPYQSAELGLAREKFAYDQRQDSLKTIFALMDEANQRRQLEERARQAAADRLLQAGPSIAGEGNFYGGFQPGGAYDQLSRILGIPFEPRHIAVAPLDVNPAPVAASPPDPALLQLLGIGG